LATRAVAGAPAPVTSPTFWGRHARVVVTAGLSKAFGLTGLRAGWILAPAALQRRLCHYQDYTTLTPTALSDRLATVAMEPRRRDTLLAGPARSPSCATPCRSHPGRCSTACAGSARS